MGRSSWEIPNIAQDQKDSRETQRQLEDLGSDTFAGLSSMELALSTQESGKGN